MAGKVIRAADRDSGVSHGNLVHWVSKPAISGAERLVVIDATVDAGAYHGFHMHPRQEEILYVIDGQVEQWLEETPHLLEVGDAMFVPPGVVHATFNRSERPARVMAIASPCVGEAGHELVAVEEQEPWASHLRSRL